MLHLHRRAGGGAAGAKRTLEGGGFNGHPFARPHVFSLCSAPKRTRCTICFRADGSAQAQKQIRAGASPPPTSHTNTRHPPQAAFLGPQRVPLPLGAEARGPHVALLVLVPRLKLVLQRGGLGGAAVAEPRAAGEDGGEASGGVPAAPGRCGGGCMWGWTPPPPRGGPWKGDCSSHLQGECLGAHSAGMQHFDCKVTPPPAPPATPAGPAGATSFWEATASDEFNPCSWPFVECDATCQPNGASNIIRGM